MDVGKSLNPAIDTGQIEGGFIQGCGLLTLEELKVSPDGVRLSRGPGMYKIPSFGDIPSQFNVYFLKDAPNEKAVYSSKVRPGVGNINPTIQIFFIYLCFKICHIHTSSSLFLPVCNYDTMIDSLWPWQQITHVLYKISLALGDSEYIFDWVVSF